MVTGGRCPTSGVTIVQANDWLPLCVDALPPPYDYVISEIYWNGTSLARIGKELGLSKRSVARLRNRGLKMLQGVENIEDWLESWAS